MFHSHVKSTGREYTAVVAWLAIAVVFIPALFFVMRATYVSISLATAGSAAFTVMAIVRWKISSKLYVPSIEARVEETR